MGGETKIETAFSHTVSDGPMFSSARNNRCTVFFPPKLNYREVFASPPHGRDLCQRHVCLSSGETKIENARGRWEEGGGKGREMEILKMADGPTARGNSGANFEGPFFPRRGERRRQPKITPLSRTTQSCRGRPISWPWANRVQTVPLGGANCASPLSYLREVDLSIKRLLPGRARTSCHAMPCHAASRIKLEGVSLPL